MAYAQTRPLMIPPRTRRPALFTAAALALLALSVPLLTRPGAAPVRTELAKVGAGTVMILGAARTTPAQPTPAQLTTAQSATAQPLTVQPRHPAASWPPRCWGGCSVEGGSGPESAPATP